MTDHFHMLRTLRWSAWLAWQIESNWTRLWLFAVYVLVKPLTASLLLVCMYWAAQLATSGGVPAGYLPFLFVSSALYMVVGGVTFGMSSAVIADREQYGMLKYIRVSPVRLQNYLIGRGLSRSLQSALGVLVVLTVGFVALPEVRESLGRYPVDWAWLLVYLFIGVNMLVSLGLILAGILLNMARHGQFLSEALSSLLYLLSGVVFPIEVLPVWLRQVSLMLPTTYWLEGMRRALLGPGQLSSALDHWSHPKLAFALLATTVTLGIFAYHFFAWCERRAWQQGRFDQATGY